MVVDKTSGWTSHDVVDAAREWIGGRRVGHMGTLDPLANGVLQLAVRAATKLVPYVLDHDKSYAGTIHPGVETVTLDAQGRETRRLEGALPEEEAVRCALESFLGEIEQIPPMYSAVKMGGVPLHKLAREGREVERDPKSVTIHRIQLHKYEPPFAEITVDCSGGTYVRALAADLGAALGCGAHLANLRRTRSGPFLLSQAHTPEELAACAEAGTLAQKLIPPLGVLGLPALRLGPEEIRQLQRGGELLDADSRQAPGTRMVAHDERGDVVAIVELRPGRRIKPLRVLATAAAGPGPEDRS
jgi:tRNA pseudouridine55 synthase